MFYNVGATTAKLHIPIHLFGLVEETERWWSLFRPDMEVAQIYCLVGTEVVFKQKLT